MAKNTGVYARQRITAYLQENGPATMSELAEELGLNKHTASSTLNFMLAGSKETRRIIYIHSWTNHHTRSRTYPRRVYALGRRKNAAKPIADVLVKDRLRKSDQQERHRTNFVFHLGTAPKDRKR